MTEPTAHRRHVRAWLDHFRGCAQCRAAKEKAIKARWKIGLCGIGQGLWDAVGEDGE